MQLFVKDKGFYSRLLVLAVPITLQGLINFGINVVDTMMLGQLGEVSLSAAALANQFCFLFMILNFGMAGGAGVLTGQFWGKGDRAAIERTLSIVLRLSEAVALAFFLACQIAPQGILSLYSNDPAVIQQGGQFLKIISWSFLVQGLSTVSAIVLRTVGVVRLTLVTSLITLLNNLFFNWVLVFGNLGAPAMGVAGSATATTISRVLEFIVIAVFLLRIDKKIGFRLRSLFHLDRDILRDYARNGLPVLISDTFLAVGMNVSSAIVGHLGANFVAANSITMVVWQLMSVLLMGIAGASSVIVGNTVGQRRYDDVQRYGVTFLTMSAIVGVIALAGLYLLRGVAADFYNVTAETRSLVAEIMAATAVVSALSSVNMMLTKGVLRAGGDTKFLMLADVLFLWVVSIPLGYVMALVLHMPAWLIIFALRIDEVIKAVWCTMRLLSGKWIKNVTIGVGEDAAEPVQAVQTVALPEAAE